MSNRREKAIQAGIYDATVNAAIDAYERATKNTDESDSRQRILAAADLMNPGGGSLETTAACQALYLICLAQQDEIEELKAQLAPKV